VRLICPHCQTKIDLSKGQQSATMLGATGEFPYGKSAPDDEGELRAGIATDLLQGIIRIDFGKAVTYLAFPPGQARALAVELLARADAIEKRRT
jgi:hypothetical protein